MSGGFAHSEWVTVLALIALSAQLIRVAMDLIQAASAPDPPSPPATATESTSAATSASTTAKEKNDDANDKNKNNNSTVNKNEDDKKPKIVSKYGSVQFADAPTDIATGSTKKDNDDDAALDDNDDDNEEEGVQDEEQQPLVVKKSNGATGTLPSMSESRPQRISRMVFYTCIWIILFIIFTGIRIGHWWTLSFPPVLITISSIVVAMEIGLLYRDGMKIRYGTIQRYLQLLVAIVLWITYSSIGLQRQSNKKTLLVNVVHDPVLLRSIVSSSSLGDWIIMTATTVHVVLVVIEGWISPRPSDPKEAESTNTTAKKMLPRKAVFRLLRPYFWPDATDCSATRNRARAVATWICVLSGKVCNLSSPLLLGWASTALAHQDYKLTIQYAILYSFISAIGTTLKEGQTLFYMGVAQAAFIQLSEASFGHLHSLSLDWHLKKKLGEVLRSMDRGIQACDTLMRYLFLWLVPALAECLAVCVIFATYFSYLPLAVSVYYFVFTYVVWTILVTLWRKKFRKALVSSDNEWHDRFTDSMVNFETVKYFTAEEFEKKRFSEAVSRYQRGSVNVQGSLSFLNISQQVILQCCLATSLSLAALGIKQRINCCVETVGCDSSVSECCRRVSNDICPGMQVGDFVAVLTYTLNLFAPLNFLGSVYNAIVMAVVDLSSMSELLAENPDVVDAPDAIDLPPENRHDPDVAVEFDNVYFHYPSQPSTRGLKGFSLKMKRGTTTAIVGPTGAGKTTVSRLFFRFYDVHSGAVKVNGVDVRSIKQSSLRGNIGVVPQTASLFNESIRSNLLYGRRDATHAELDQAAKDSQIYDFVVGLTDGWETAVGDRGLKLSGGEKQRAAICRCLLKNPSFVILDEATSALDTITEKSVQDALDRLGENRTVLVIAHRLGTIRNADNIVVLKDGVAAEQGTHNELLAFNGVYADLWNMQLHSNSRQASTSDMAAAEHTEYEYSSHDYE